MTTYDESIFGDFNAEQLFTLSVVHSVFVATQAWAEPDKVDDFRFIVQAGQQATINFNQSVINLSSLKITSSSFTPHCFDPRISMSAIGAI